MARTSEEAGNPQASTEEVGADFWANHEAHPEGLAATTANEQHDDGDDSDGGYNEYEYDYDVPSPNDYDQPEASQMTSTQRTDFGADLVALKASITAPKLNFARVAKRVDVQKLKQAIWEEIEVVGKPAATQDVSFSGLVHGLDSSSYPKEALKDVSVSYCFICLLHLANEHGLDIKSSGGDLVVNSA